MLKYQTEVTPEELYMIPEEAAEEGGGRRITTFAVGFSCYLVQITGGVIPRRIIEDFCGYAGPYLTHRDMAVPWMEDWWTKRIKDIPVLTVRTICLGDSFFQRAFNRILLMMTRWLWKRQGTKMFEGIKEYEDKEEENKS